MYIAENEKTNINITKLSSNSIKISHDIVFDTPYYKTTIENLHYYHSDRIASYNHIMSIKPLIVSNKSELIDGNYVFEGEVGGCYDLENEIRMDIMWFGATPIYIYYPNKRNSKMCIRYNNDLYNVNVLDGLYYSKELDCLFTNNGKLMKYLELPFHIIYITDHNDYVVRKKNNEDECLDYFEDYVIRNTKVYKLDENFNIAELSDKDRQNFIRLIDKHGITCK
jgi:hypothetical protein